MSQVRLHFERRHYEAVAKLIARAKQRPNDSVAECLSDLEQDFADLFPKSVVRLDLPASGMAHDSGRN